MQVWTLRNSGILMTASTRDVIHLVHPMQGDVGGVRPPGGDGGGRCVPGERTPRVGGQLRPGGGAVPLCHHHHARGAGPGAVGGAREPGAGEKRGCAREEVLQVTPGVCFVVVMSFFVLSFRLFPRMDVDTVGPVSS